MLTKFFRVHTIEPIESTNAQIPFSHHLTRKHAHCVKCNSFEENPTIKTRHGISQIHAMLFSVRGALFAESHKTITSLPRKESLT